jgi:hypothetical protein
MQPQLQPKLEAHPEGQMAKSELYRAAKMSMKLFQMIQDGQELEGWVQAKITKSADYLDSVYHYMEYQMKFGSGAQVASVNDITDDVSVAAKESKSEADDEEMKESTSYEQKLQALLEGAMKKAKKQSKVEEGWEDMMAANKKAAGEKGTGKFDKKTTSTGTQYTRKASTFSDGGDDTDTKKAKAKAKKANEGIADIAKKAGSALKKAGSKALDKLGHGSDEDMIKDLQKKTGMPQTGKKPMAVKNEGKKPDFLDMDKDGDKKEPMKKAIADKKKNPFVKK